MRKSDPFAQHYADLLGRRPDERLKHLVARLDAAAMPFDMIKPPRAVDDAVERAMQLRRRELLAHDVFGLDLIATNRDDGPPDSPALWVDDVSLNIRTVGRSRWIYQVGQMAAAAVVLVLLAGLLIALFKGHADVNGNQSAHFGGVPLGSALATATPQPAASVWAEQPIAKALRAAGGGKKLDLSRQVQGYTMTLHWAGATEHHVFVYYTISPPSGEHDITSVFPYDEGTLTLGNGTQLRPTNTASSQSPATFLSSFDASQVKNDAGNLQLTLAFRGLGSSYTVGSDGQLPPGVVILTPPAHGADGVSIPLDKNGLMHSFYMPGDHVARLTISEAFTFKFTVPYQPGIGSATPAATPFATPSTPMFPAPEITRDQAMSIAQTFLGTTNGRLEAKLFTPDTSLRRSDLSFFTQSHPNLWIVETSGTPGTRAINGDTVVIGAVSGRVLKATLASAEASVPHIEPPTLSNSMLRATAEAFARQRSGGFDQLHFVENRQYEPSNAASLMAALPGAVPPRDSASFTWREHDAQTGAWLGSWVTVSVDRRTGRIVGYLAQFESSTIGGLAAINRERASQIGLEEARALGASPDVWVKQVTLTTVTSSGADHLAWIVEFAGTTPSGFSDSGTLRYVTIDAQTGERWETAMNVGMQPYSQP